MKERILNAVENFFKLYVIVYGFTIMASVVFMYAFGYHNLSREFLLHAMLFSFIALIPVIVFLILPSEIIDGHLILMQIISLIFNELTLMPYGFHIGMWNSVKSGIVMAIIIFIINMITPLVAFGRDALLSSQINKKLDQFRDEEESDE